MLKTTNIFQFRAFFIQRNKMDQRVCGLVGGLSYVSTVDYYNQMNELVNRFAPGHSSRIHIVSLDIFHYVDQLEKRNWTEVIQLILDGVERLLKSSVDFVLVCSNTGHIAAPKIAEIYPNVVFLHISDAVAYAIKEKKLKKIGFLGSKYSMVPDSCVVSRLIQHDFDIVFPNDEEKEEIHRVILEELTINVLDEKSRQFYVKVIERLVVEHQVEGVVLGCTEIPLLVKQNDVSSTFLFDSTKLHVQLAVDYQLGRCDIDAFLPNRRSNEN